MVITGYPGYLIIGGVKIPVKSWNTRTIVKSWYDAWAKRMGRG